MGVESFVDNSIVVIPARGGSKTVPGKNVRLIAGKPLLAWSVEAALASAQFSRVIVSTDNAQIADVAKRAGADVPYLRPTELAQDDTSTVAVALHMLDWLEQNGDSLPDWVMVLQPTSPLRTADDINNTVEMTRSGAPSVASVTEAIPHPYLAGKIRGDGVLYGVPALELQDNRRQSFPDLYALNGAIYYNRSQAIRTERKMVTADTHAYVMPPERSLDIDSPWDFYLAELILKDPYGQKR